MSAEQWPGRVHGFYEEQFWEYVARRDLRLQRSASTGRLRYPPSPVCPDTLDPDFEWVPIAGVGELLSWTVFHRAYFPGIPTPYTVLAVRSAEGPLMVGHRPGDAPAELRIGMPVLLTYDEVVTEDGPMTLFNWVPLLPVEPTS
jgi:uncharacterized OB-fold protein